jgi:hypothetical protein
MKRRLMTMGLVLSAALGCQLPPDQEPLRPLREHGPRLKFDDLVSRARRQADLALEASYANNWGDLEDLAKALEQTAQFVPTAPDAPDPKKNEAFIKTSRALSGDAARLNAAARAVANLSGDEKEKKIKEINGLLLGINKSVRTLKPAP